MVTHPNRSRKTISVKLTEDELDWLYHASVGCGEDMAATGEDTSSYPGATDELDRKLLVARTELRARQK